MAMLGENFMLDYSYNPKIMAMSIISVFALAYPMPPIYYIVRVAAWPFPLPPCPALKPAFMQYRRALPCWGAVLTVHTGQPARKPRSTFPHQTHQKSPAHLAFCTAQPFPFPSHPPPPPSPPPGV